MAAQNAIMKEKREMEEAKSNGKGKAKNNPKAAPKPRGGSPM